MIDEFNKEKKILSLDEKKTNDFKFCVLYIYIYTGIFIQIAQVCDENVMTTVFFFHCVNCQSVNRLDLSTIGKNVWANWRCNKAETLFLSVKFDLITHIIISPENAAVFSQEHSIIIKLFAAMSGLTVFF